MQLTIIGQGNVGTHLAQRAREMGHDVQTWSRHEGGSIPAAPIYIICVTDSAIASVAQQLPADAVVAHTSGSTSISVLPQARRAVLYPMQTFSKAKSLDWTQIPLFVEGDSLITELAQSLMPRSVQTLSSEQRLHLHIAAVWACNFANHCIALGAEQMEEAGLDWQLLLPLIDETVAKLRHLHPRQGQTGPAIRHDERILSLHESVLPSQLSELYELLSRSIQRTIPLPR